jgi:hypothetical protein
MTTLSLLTGNFKVAFVAAILGDIKGVLIEEVIIFDPEQALESQKRGVPEAQLVHSDDPDGTRILNFIIALADGYLIRLFDQDNLSHSAIAALQSFQWVMFGRDLHQGIVCLRR